MKNFIMFKTGTIFHDKIDIFNNLTRRGVIIIKINFFEITVIIFINGYGSEFPLQSNLPHELLI